MPEWLAAEVLSGVGTTAGFFLALIIGRRLSMR